MKVVTFYADAELPAGPAAKSRGFDWRWAVNELSRTARSALDAETLVVTDLDTPMWYPWVRTGDAHEDGIMLWLLDAQAAAIARADGPILMVSPDTLINGPVPMFGDWDVCLLTRERPRPIVNSVISVMPGPAVSRLWRNMAERARNLPPKSIEWGADIDILVDVLRILPNEDAVRTISGVRVRLMPLAGLFRSIDPGAPARRLAEPIWDFKGRRKQRMPDYAALL